MRDGFKQCAISIGRGDKFEQPHVARGIEEMRTKPERRKSSGKSFGDLGHG